MWHSESWGAAQAQQRQQHAAALLATHPTAQARLPADWTTSLTCQTTCHGSSCRVLVLVAASDGDCCCVEDNREWVGGAVVVSYCRFEISVDWWSRKTTATADS